MKKHFYRSFKLISLLVTMITMVFFFSLRADAAYLYEFQFDELQVGAWDYYAADGFSFTSPELLGPSFTGSPYIQDLPLSSPLNLNTFTFDGIAAAGSYNSTTDELYSVNFSPASADWDADNRNVADFWVNISIHSGETYGPGNYVITSHPDDNGSFGRGIMNAENVYYAGYGWFLDKSIVYEYGSGSLTITEMAVSEPTTMLLLGFGLMGLVGVRRKLRG